MNFYYHLGKNLCAEESWVVGYLIENGYCETKEEAIDNLHTCRNFGGWFDCEVSNTIYERVGVYYGVI